MVYIELFLAAILSSLKKLSSVTETPTPVAFVI